MKWKNWLKARLRKWLEIDEQERQITKLEAQIIRLEQLTHDLVSIGVDVHFKEPHMILIYSRLHGGQIREIRADFDNIRELNDFVQWLKDKFNTSIEVWDDPMGMHRIHR